MLRNRVPSYPELAARYPRLVRAMRWAACLSETEALNALYMRKIGDNWAGEAVNHFGGVAAVLKGAMRCRHYVRRLPKSAGQLAYEAECKVRPNYDDGSRRPSWAALCDVAKWSWERNPTPRWTA